MNRRPSHEDLIQAARAEVRAPLVPLALGPAFGEREGDRVGRYLLRRAIGEGGFGTVWLAEQEEPVRREVALKILKPGMDTAQVVQRFEAERQALALMEHPHIAKVLDGGATPGGRPYFVMEYVRGVSITEFCAEAGLDRVQRLRLFTAVCRAVQHAHQKGVIHRDLKPSNILVAEENGAPVPQVIDFGIARAVEPDSASVALTRDHQSLGTPEYMAPEQMVGEPGRSIDTRVDVWSLGVLLYELLTGSRPFEWKTQESGVDTFFQTVRTVDCERPSTRLAARREPARVPSKQNAKALKGDLDWICLKALSKDPAERYATAQGLAEDIERHLAHEPVQASPPSRTVAAAKWVRRNRGAVAALSTIVLLLTGGVVALSIALGQKNEALGRAIEQEQRAVAAETTTRRELEFARELGEVLSRMLASVNPEQARGGDVTLLRSILDDTASRIERGEIENARVEAQVRRVIGSTYQALALLDRAQPHLERAFELVSTEFEPESDEVQETRSALASLYYEQEKFEASLELERETLEISKRTYGPQAKETLSAHSNIGKVLWSWGRLEEALEIQRECYEKLSEGAREPDEDVLDARHALGLILVDLAQWEEAEEHLRGALEWRREELGGDHPSTLKSESALADLLHSTGRSQEAEVLLRASIERIVRVMGEDAPLALGARRNLADALMTLGRFDEARVEYEKVLGHQRSLQHRDSDVARTLNNLAILHAQSGRLEKAEEAYREAWEIKLEVLGPDHQSTLGTQANLGGLLYNLERDHEALELLEPAVEAMERVLGPEHPWRQSAQRVLDAVREALEYAESN